MADRSGGHGVALVVGLREGKVGVTMHLSVREAIQSDPTEGGQAAYIPLRFLTDFIDFSIAHPDRIEVITYDDMPWADDYDAAKAYPSERLRWEEQLRAGDRDPTKIYILLQHDVDTRPDRSMAVLRYELARGVRSNLMIFMRRVDRRHFQGTGELRFTPYELDGSLLDRASRAGFVIAYHQNAFEQSHFDERQAQRIFEEDVRLLAQRFPIRFTSAHGGTPAPDGRNNLNVSMPLDLRSRVRWVYNGFSPWFAGTYSDGGINSPKRDPAKRDLRDFVRTWRPGKRYRVLTHPQYYALNPGISPRLAGARWYEEIRRHYQDPDAPSVWDAVAGDLFGRGEVES
jgi:hypothetical protein